MVRRDCRKGGEIRRGKEERKAKNRWRLSAEQVVRGEMVKEWRTGEESREDGGEDNIKR